MDEINRKKKNRLAVRSKLSQIHTVDEKRIVDDRVDYTPLARSMYLGDALS